MWARLSSSVEMTHSASDSEGDHARRQQQGGVRLRHRSTAIGQQCDVVDPCAAAGRRDRNHGDIADLAAQRRGEAEETARAHRRGKQLVATIEVAADPHERGGTRPEKLDRLADERKSRPAARRTSTKLREVDDRLQARTTRAAFQTGDDVRARMSWPEGRAGQI